MKSIFFNAMHSPIGAYATFTLGYPGQSGGFGIELGKPADQNIYIGVESIAPGIYQALPFHDKAVDDRARFEVERTSESPRAGKPRIVSFGNDEISREFRLASDTWRAGDLTFTLYSAAYPVPEPGRAPAGEVAMAVIPAIVGELTVDNTGHDIPRKAFVGFIGNDPYTFMRHLDDLCDPRICGVGQGRHVALAALRGEAGSGTGFTIEEIIAPAHEENLSFNGGCGCIFMTVGPRCRKTMRLAFCFYRGGFRTAGIDAAFYYTRFYPDIGTVALRALENFDHYRARAIEADAALERSGLSEDQKFLIAQAVRSYCGNTELLDYEGKPFWIVNEGEYRMMNTLDLTVDQLFYEMKMHPWTVRNTLDRYLSRFSYVDEVCFPGDPKRYPGGISFTHDMGIAQSVSRPHHSAYEMAGLSGCFSHMTHEQLVNWILCAAVYFERTGDEEWLAGVIAALKQCLASMLNRDHPDPRQRTGIMGLDSSRTKGGAEITTYDSLDASLGQARNNTYLAVKSWAAYIAMERIFRTHGMADESAQALLQAQRCARTLVSEVTPQGYMPAIIGESNDSKIIPAVEGLVFPYLTNCRDALDPHGRFGDLIRALKRHLEYVLSPGVCLFPSGAWKMSSTSNNSWPSKIYLCQFVARVILGVRTPATGDEADAAHVERLLHGSNGYWAASDQIIFDEAKGARYYPRLVTCILWLDPRYLRRHPMLQGEAVRGPCPGHNRKMNREYDDSGSSLFTSERVST